MIATDIVTFGSPEGNLLFGFLHADGAFYSAVKIPKVKQRAPRSGWGFPYILPSYFLIILWKSTGTPHWIQQFPLDPHPELGFLPLDTVLVFYEIKTSNQGENIFLSWGITQDVIKMCFAYGKIFKPSLGTWSLLGACFSSGMKLAKSQICLFLSMWVTFMSRVPTGYA